MPGDCSLMELTAQLTLHERLPLHVGLELTTACNQSCRHCYLLEAQDYQPDTLPAELVQALLQVLREEGTLTLLLTGGEPLLHPQFAELYRAAVTSGFLVALLTNATLIDEPVADLLAELPPWRVALTLYGASAETYAAVADNPEGYGAVCRALELLAARRVPCLVKYTVLRENAADLAAAARLAESYGAPFLLDGGLSPARDGCTAPLAHRLPPAELAALEASLPPVAEVLASSAEATERAAGAAVFQCNAGVNQCFINARGELSVCIEDPRTWPLDRAEVAGSFRRIFHQEFAELLAEEGLAPECRECELWTLCPRCPAWRRKEAGARGAVVPFFCALARARRDQARRLQGGGTEE